MSEQLPPDMREPSEEELRQYLGEMRQAHVGEIVAQVVSALLNGAQVKLGRRDARLLIDLAAAVNDQAGPYLEQRFEDEVTQVLSQLRMAQVEAEQELAQLRASGQAPPEANDVGPESSGGQETSAEGEAPSAGDAGEARQPPPSAPPQAGSRLWTPGG
jgi:ribosomal protein L29